jgi:hypothetical protein
VQFFPPAAERVDDVDMFHLYVFDEGSAPAGVNIRKR